MKNPDQPDLAIELEASFCAMDPPIARRFAAATFLSDNRADLAHCGKPVLILQSDQDSVAPVEVGRYLHEHLIHSTLQLMEATGHCPHMSHPQETIELMRAYFQTSG